MTILAIDNTEESLRELADNLQAVFPQETITAFGSPLFALQYVYNHPKEIGLIFSPLTMQHLDGITLAKGVKKHSPGVKIFFLVQTENSELAAIAKQHGDGACLPRPITVERIEQATHFLREPCLWEEENCEEGCLWEWCEHRKHKASFKKHQILVRRKRYV